ncbi:DUF1206 domain-containing protein [Hoyosella rhizosphaerae]|uniref:DUF1206 domain-containing protein n=1 Tax=Hoyosella rhizosphaerae TaxID=1755582 RepID=UPI00227C8322|nr:DUF1206 domain-containing protein [Hoyosella rhizosphaerae]
MFEGAARVGFVVSGLLHIAIGYLSLNLAFGVPTPDTDHTGAFAEIARERGGTIALWLIAAVLTTMALWRAIESVFGRAYDSTTWRDLSITDRVKAFSLAVIYGAFAYSAGQFAAGKGDRNDFVVLGLVAELMFTTAGTIILVLVGLGVFTIGAYHIHKGVMRTFHADLMGRPGLAVHVLGVVAWAGKGVVISGVGIAVIVATARAAPRDAMGLDAALRSVRALPFGAFALVVAGVFLITYGIYSFVLARHAKM